MKKIKKSLKTIIWTIIAFIVGAFIPAPSYDILNWGIPCLFALVTFVLCIKGKLPGTDMQKIIELQRKKTPWYLCQFSLGAVFLLAYFAFIVYHMIKNMGFDYAHILISLLFLSIIISCVISIWETRKDVDFQIKKRKT